MPRQILFIMTDTQRTDMLGCYGNPDLKTPALDQLAKDGLRFNKAYTCQPVCGPARAALFTGLYSHTTGAWGNSMAIGDNVKTLGQRLTDNGIHCGYIGKWHVDGSDYFGLGKCPQGWDEKYWYDMRRYLEELSNDDRFKSRRPETNEDPSLSAEFTFGHRVSSRANQFIEEYKDRDFCLVVSYDEPHGPCLAPKPYSDMYKGYEFPKSANVYDTLNDKPEHQQAWSGKRRFADREALKIGHDDFFGCHTFVDHEIGTVLDAAKKLAPDALVIYTSDHGDLLQSHSMHGKGPAMYEEITRIPFLVKWPGHVKAGGVCDSPVSHIDVVPTMLDFFGVPLPKWVDGQSILKTFEKPSLRQNDAVFIEFGRYEVDHDGFGGFQPIRCVTDGRYKLVINLLSTDELYDLQTDSQEMKNLLTVPELAKVRDTLHDRLLDWMNKTRDPFRGYYWHRRPWRTDAPPPSWDYTGFTRQRENEEYEPRQLDYATGLPMTQSLRIKEQN